MRDKEIDRPISWLKENFPKQRKSPKTDLSFEEFSREKWTISCPKERKMKKRILDIVLVGALVSGLCAVGGGIALAQTEVLWWISSGAFLLAFQDYVKPQYEAAHPDVKLILETPATGGVEFSRALLSRIQTGDPPDLVSTNSSSDPWLWSLENWFLDVTDVMEERGWGEKMAPGYDAAAVRGRMYFVPYLATGTPYLIYNKDVFDENGLTEPNTLEEFYHVVDVVKSQGYEALAVGNRDGWPAEHIWSVLGMRSMLWERYKTLWSSWRPEVPPTVKVTDPDVLFVYELMKEWVERGVFSKGMMAMNSNEGRGIFETEKAVMFSAHQLHVQRLADANLPFEFDIARFPTVNRDIPKRLMYEHASWQIVPYESELQEIAFDIIDFILSEEVQINMCRITGYLPAVILSPEGYQELIELVDWRTGKVLKWVELMAPLGLTPEMTVSAALTSGLMTDMRKALSSMLMGEMSPLETARTTQGSLDKTREQMIRLLKDKGISF